MKSANLAAALKFVDGFYSRIAGQTTTRLFPRLGSSVILETEDTAEGVQLRGLTLDILAWHSADADYSVCSLAQTLETAQEWQRRGETLEAWQTYIRKYLLSPAACAGILRRAKKWERTLPPMLEQALSEMGAKHTPKASQT